MSLFLLLIVLILNFSCSQICLSIMPKQTKLLYYWKDIIKTLVDYKWVQNALRNIWLKMDISPVLSSDLKTTGLCKGNKIIVVGNVVPLLVRAENSKACSRKSGKSWKIRAQILENIQLEFAYRTIQNLLSEACLNSRIAANELYIRPINISKQSKWARNIYIGSIGLEISSVE